MKRLKEKEIFQYWKEKYNQIDEDGVVDWDKYLKQNNKILLILKETNGLYGNLKEFLKKDARWQTWNMVIRWIFGIENLGNNPIEKFNKISHVDNHL